MYLSTAWERLDGFRSHNSRDGRPTQETQSRDIAWIDMARRNEIRVIEFKRTVEKTYGNQANRPFVIPRRWARTE